MKIKASLFKKPLSLSMFSMFLLFASAQPSHANNLGNAIGGAIGNILGNIGGAVGGAVMNAADILAKMVAVHFHAAAVNKINKVLGLGACEGNGQISDVLCNVLEQTSTLPGLVTALAYFGGLLLAVTALFKLKDHVLNPSQTPLSDSLKRFVAGGFLFSLPVITEATQNLLTGGGNSWSGVSVYAGSAAGGGGLDGMLVALFADIYAPLMSLIFAFGYFAGLVLVVVGIRRMINTAQDGARGPASMGTIMTFVVAGVLFSLSTIMGAFSNSLFQSTTVATFAVMSTSTGDDIVDDHILAIISTVLVFMTIIGYISFLRGFFMIKDVAEGNSQASLMAAVTHIFGGALAVNLGPLLNAVQVTLGLDTLGVMFY